MTDDRKKLQLPCLSKPITIQNITVSKPTVCIYGQTVGFLSFLFLKCLVFGLKIGFTF